MAAVVYTTTLASPTAELARRIHERSFVTGEFTLRSGLEMGGIPVATVLSQLSGLSTRFVRKQAKTYGTCQLAEGGEISGRRIAIIEDVITTAGQVVQSAGALRQQGAKIDTVLCVIDREAGGRERLAQEGLRLRSLFTISDLQSASPS